MGGDIEDIAQQDPLLGLGIIDSTGVLELVAFLERTFDIKVNDEDIAPENLDTLAGIAAFVQRKRRAAPTDT